MKPLFEAINNIFVEDQDIEKLSKHPYYKGVSKDDILDRHVDAKLTKYIDNCCICNMLKCTIGLLMPS